MTQSDLLLADLEEAAANAYCDAASAHRDEPHETEMLARVSAAYDAAIQKLAEGKRLHAAGDYDGLALLCGVNPQCGCSGLCDDCYKPAVQSD